MKHLSGIIFVIVTGMMLTCIAGCISDDATIKGIKNHGLVSEAFPDGGTIPDEYTCTGKGISPPLSWTEPPEGTEGFALTLSDPDAPYGMFTHWVVWNIPYTLRKLPEDASKTFIADSRIMEGINDYGETGYGAPCPPAGPAHRYIFRLYALDFTPELPAESDAEMLCNEIGGHILTEYELTGIYGR